MMTVYIGELVRLYLYTTALYDKNTNKFTNVLHIHLFYFYVF
jgi:hypothetical protein